MQLVKAIDLGCLDLGCLDSDKKTAEKVRDSEKGEASNGSSSSKSGKSKSSKETSPTALSSLNRVASQIKKPPHRKNSPLNWFPRKKVDSYLKRKLKMLQELDGMNLTLDETLGDSNPHYCRVLREKIAAREAAHKAMEARKAAMVEASWCRILQAARIESKEAEAILSKAEKTAAEAFEAAMAIGVIMFDIPNCPQKTCQIETYSAKGSTTHTVKASFETAFEVDKQVAAAVKTAFVKLANCPSFNQDEFKELLRKISENPDTGDCNQEVTEVFSDCESEAGSELETVSQTDDLISQELECKLTASETRRRKFKRRLSLEKFSLEKLVEMMLERLKCLREDELSSLATIVATCGLNAALAEGENIKLDPSASGLSVPRRMSSAGVGTIRKTNHEKKVNSELPSLDKFLVKHMTRLEREVQEAKNKRNESTDDSSGSTSLSETASSEVIPDLGSILVKKASRLEKEIQETKKNNRVASEMNGKKAGGMLNGRPNHVRADVPEVPSLDKYLVKHVSRLEREVEKAKIRRKDDAIEGGRKTNEDACSFDLEKENADLNTEDSHENRKNQRKQGGNKVMEYESLDKLLVKHVSKLEREKMRSNETVEVVKVNKSGTNALQMDEEESLDKVLVKHKSRLEKEKIEAASQPEEQNRRPLSRREARQRELQESWGGLSLGDSISSVEKEKTVAAVQPEEPIRPAVSRKEARQRELQETWGGLSLGDSISQSPILKKEASVKPEETTKPAVSRREARQRELQETWGGLSLGNSIKPHVSKLEKDKAAWIKAEDEERRQVMNEV